MTTDQKDSMDEIVLRLARIEDQLAEVIGRKSRRLSPKELAKSLEVSERYVRGMKAKGFRMPGGLATVSEALEWLEENPDYRVNG